MAHDERRDSARARREQLSVVEAIFGQAIASFVLLDADGRIVRLSEAFARRLGLGAAALPGRRFAQVAPDQLVLRGLEEVVRTRQPVTVNGRHGDWRWSLTPILGDAGELEFVLATGVDLTELKRTEERLRTSETVYQSVFNAMNEGVVFQSADGSIVAANPAAEQILGVPVTELGGRDSNDPRWAAVREDGSPFPGEQHPSMVTLRTGAPQTDVVMGLRRPDGERIWIAINSQPLIQPGKALPQAVVTTFHDITERKAAEARQAQMMHELNHRVKNTLTVVQSIALQTLRVAPDLAAFGEAFNARLLALSHSHDLLTRTDWTGAQVRELVTEQLRPYQTAVGDRFRLAGPDVRLSPKAAVALGIALSELATNAIKYGALSADQGTVDVSWECRAEAGAPRLQLVWREQGGPVVRPPAKRGLGTRLIERGLPYELGGVAHLAFNPEGVAYDIDFPLKDGVG
jgi:PAS domain S-box-containing protein